MIKIKYISLVFILFIFGNKGFSQNSIEHIISEIEKNNLTLSALKNEMEADKLEHREQNYLQNPEVEFGYLWGNPSSIGNRKDFSIMQSFDFPTAYKQRSDIRKMRDNQANANYLYQKNEILFEAKSICYNLIYLNGLIDIFKEKMEDAEQIFSLYQKKEQEGGASILDLNKVKLSYFNSKQVYENLIVERRKALAELTALNGGNKIEFSEKIFSPIEEFLDFEEWFSRAKEANPNLLILDEEKNLRKRDVQLKRSMALPKFHTGYVSETVVGEDFKGFSVGVTIPLWENRKSVKQAKIRSLVVDEIAVEQETTWEIEWKSNYEKAVDLKKRVEEYNSIFEGINSQELLGKALELGEISLIEYFFEIYFYYDSLERKLQQEHSLNLVIAELNRYL